MLADSKRAEVRESQEALLEGADSIHDMMVGLQVCPPCVSCMDPSCGRTDTLRHCQPLLGSLRAQLPQRVGPAGLDWMP